MTTNIKEIHSNQTNKLLQYQNKQQLSHDTQILKQKMRALQIQIESLQKLKRQGKNGSRLSQRTQSNSQRKQQNRRQSLSKEIRQENIIVKKPSIDFTQNYKNNKIGNLMNQLSSQNQLQKIKKASLNQSFNTSTKKHSVNQLKQKLQRLNKSQSKRKKVPINIMQLKGVVHKVDSNIFNVTVAQIMTQQHEKYEMIKEIKDLKQKLKQLENKKKENIQKKRYVSNLQNPFQNNSFFRSQDEGVGKIFSVSKISQNSNSKNKMRDLRYSKQSIIPNLGQQFEIQNNQKSIQLKKNTNPLAWNPQVSLTAIQPLTNHRINRTGRFYSTINMQVNKSNDYLEDKKQQNSKKPLFKILKKKYAGQALKKQNQKNVQQQRKIIDLLPQMKLQRLRTNTKVLQNFIPNFRQYIKQKCLQFTLPPQPSTHDSQADLQSLGLLLFSLFDIYVQQQTKIKGVEYKVTKYKNCVLFRLNDAKNIVWYFDGKFYFGGWEISLIGQGKKQGFGIEIIPMKYIYQGYFVNNKREGYGIMLNHFRSDTNRNVVYEGYWNQGLKNGKGYQIQDQFQYLGDFNDGLQTGTCKIRTKNTFYEGTIKQSVKQGKGHQILKNGDQYYGQFKSNMFHGQGEYKWKSGAYFYGQFVQGLRKGKGIWISKLNSDIFDSYKGEYNQNKKQGYGMYQWANGTIYQGYFKNDLRHDQGMMKYPNGKAGKFIWKEGNKAYKIYSQEQELYRKKAGLQSISKLEIDTLENLNLQNQQEEQSLNENFVPRIALIELQKESSQLFLYNK